MRQSLERLCLPFIQELQVGQLVPDVGVALRKPRNRHGDNLLVTAPSSVILSTPIGRTGDQVLEVRGFSILVWRRLQGVVE